MLNIYDIFFAFQISVLAYVVSCVLMQEKYLLEKYLDFVIWLINKDKAWLAYPLGYCEKCFAGQLALWLFLAFHSSDYKVDFWHTLFCHILIIAFSIIFVIPLKKYLKE